jgi:hypothetical protein
VDNYGDETELTTAEWRESMTVALANQQELIEVLQKQSDICTEELAQLKLGVAENSAMTKETRDNSSEMLEVFKLMKGGMKVIEFIGKLGKVVAMIGAGYAAYQKLKHGEWPIK